MKHGGTEDTEELDPILFEPNLCALCDSVFQKIKEQAMDINVLTEAMLANGGIRSTKE